MKRRNHRVQLGARLLLTLFFIGMVFNTRVGWTDVESEIEEPGGSSTHLSLIHIGDIHGHLIPRPNLRSDSTGRPEGGLARMYTLIEELRAKHPNHLLVNTGDTIQGSAEALYTQGQALVDVLNLFGIDAFAPGNWEYLYGTERFLQLFGGTNPGAPWTALAANLYYSGPPYADKVGQRVLPPYIVKTVGGLRVGIIGLTNDRGPTIVGSNVVEGFSFSTGDAELAELVPLIRSQENVDLLIAISERGLANNIRLSEAYPGIDVILSSDMHEETGQAVVSRAGTIIVEEGQDGTRLGELNLEVSNKSIVNWTWHMHVIDDRIREHPQIAAKVAEVRKTFVAGPDFTQHINPINQTTLKTPIDTVIGYADVGLHRANFAHEPMPAVIEGSSHNFLADVFREMSQADIGSIRGFRFGTQVAPGPIKLEDIYHFIPIGPFIAKGDVTGQQLKDHIELTTNNVLDPDIKNWGGGWLFSWSGLKYDLNPYQLQGNRCNNIQVQNRQTGAWEPLDLTATYSFAAYYYDSTPGKINKVPANNIQIVTDAAGNRLDGTEVVMEYLKTRNANPAPDRIRLLQALPPYRYGNPEIEPLHGARY